MRRFRAPELVREEPGDKRRSYYESTEQKEGSGY